MSSLWGSSLANWRGWCLGAVHHQLEVHGAAPLVAVVEDVLGPGLALYVDQDARPGFLKEHSDEGAEIALLVGEGVVVGREAAARDVLDWPDVLHVSWILALT